MSKTTLVFLVANSVALISAMAFAQTWDTSSFVLDKDASLNKNGAERLVVKLESGDNSGATTAYLEGVNKGKTLWKRSFPLKGEINFPKSSVTTKGRMIEISSQAPFHATTYTQRFLWDGNQLTFKSDHVDDSSIDALNEYFDIATKGTRAEFEKAQKTGSLEIIYPQNYVTSERISKLVQDGREVAEALYRKGNAAGAAERMELCLDCAADLAMLNDADDQSSKDKISNWLDAFSNKKLAMTPNQYVPAMNDYAFFLQEQKKHELAVPVLRQVLLKEPNRVVAYLNLADSLWETGAKSESKRLYTDYVAKLEHTSDRDKIPLRARERSNPG